MSGERADRRRVRRVRIEGGDPTQRDEVRRLISGLGWEAAGLDGSPAEARPDVVVVLDGADAEEAEGQGVPVVRVGGERTQGDVLGWVPWPPSQDLLHAVIEARCRLTEVMGSGVDVEDERYRTLVETAPLDIVVVDRHGSFRFMNGHAAKPLGISPAEAVGKTLWDLFPREVAEIKLGHVRGVLATGVPMQVDQLFEIRGEPRWFHSILQPLGCGQGTCDTAMVISRDITEQKALDAELLAARDRAEAASRAKTAFLANMSHELRTPLNAVVGYAQLLLETELPPLQRRYARTVADSGNVLMSLVADILDISKIEAGKVSLESVEFDLEELVEHAVRDEAHRLERKPVDLLVDYGLACPFLFRGDPVRVRQVVMNLLSNAGKFTSEGHVHLAVSCDTQDGGGPACGEPCSIRITVTDSGIGIPSNKLEAIFEVFTQADSSTTRQYGGTGLGLAIVDRLARLMGGQVTVKSTVGEGSTFTVVVPLEVVAMRSSGDRTLHDEALLRGRALTVLSESAALAGAMERFGLSVGMRVARGMPSALPRVLRTATDLIVLDLSSPSAHDALATALAEQPTRDGAPRVLAISGTSSLKEDRAPDAVVVARVQRPVTRRTFVRGLASMVATAPAPSVPNAASGPAAGDHLTVLVVEDNLVNQMLVREALRKFGCSVDVASDGQRGLELARLRAYDLVLMDVQMPVMDGLEATRGIRAHLGSELPIIALTAGALKEDVERALGAGMNDYLTKPVDIQTLRAKVVKWARRSPRDATRN